MNKNFIQGFSALLLALPIACAADFRGEAIEGWIVDAATKSPIQGAIVVVDWQLAAGMENAEASSLMLQEAVTDKAGHYVLPAWEKKKPKKGDLRQTSPLLAVYKKGYAYQAVTNRFSADTHPEALKSDWTKKTIELVPYTGDPVYYYRYNVAPARQLLQKSAELCAWQNIPKMTAALLALDQETNWPGKNISGPLLSVESLHQSGTCANPNQVLSKDAP